MNNCLTFLADVFSDRTCWRHRWKRHKYEWKQQWIWSFDWCCCGMCSCVCNYPYSPRCILQEEKIVSSINYTCEYNLSQIKWLADGVVTKSGFWYILKSILISSQLVNLRLISSQPWNQPWFQKNSSCTFWNYANSILKATWIIRRWIILTPSSQCLALELCRGFDYYHLKWSSYHAYRLSEKPLRPQENLLRWEVHQPWVCL